MTVSLKKGEKVSLVKGDAGLKEVMVGLGWDEAQPEATGFFGRLFSSTQDIDCDASVILCGENGKVVGKNIKEHCVYFGSLCHASGAVVHQGDNRTGGGEGDDEQIMVDLSKIPANVSKLVFVVNIYDGETRKQHFGMIKNAFIRLVDVKKKSEICRFNLTEDYSGMTGMIVGEIHRHQNGWQFNAVGQGVKKASRLDELISMYR